MPIFESVPIIQYVPQPVYVTVYQPIYNNSLGTIREVDGVQQTSGNGNTAGTCTNSYYHNDRPGCITAEEEWTDTFTWYAEINNKVINLELITSFQSGVRTYTDPGGAFVEGDANGNQTFITMAGAQKQMLIDVTLNDFRSKMARLF